MTRVPMVAMVLIAAFAGPALAQDGPPPPDGNSYQAPAPQHGGHGKMRGKYEAANTTHDGRLTQRQAQAAGWSGVARNFDQIDVDHKGFVTMQDVKAFSRKRAAARHQSQAGSGNGGPDDGDGVDRGGRNDEGPGPDGGPPPQ